MSRSDSPVVRKLDELLARTRSHSPSAQDSHALTSLARLTNEPVWEWDMALARLWTSGVYEDRFGAPPEGAGASSEWWVDRIHPEDRSQATGSFERALAGREEEWSARFRVRSRGGLYVPVEERVAVLRGPDGIARRLTAVTTELTTREREHRDRQTCREIFENASVGIAVIGGADFVYELVNPAYQALAPGKPMLGRKITDVWAEVDLPLEEKLRRVIEHAETIEMADAPVTIQRGPGTPPEEINLTFCWLPLPGPGGKPDRVLALATETTAAVQQRRELEQALARNQAIIAAMREGLVIADRDGNILNMNPAGIQSHGLRRPEDVRRNIRDFPEDRVRDLNGRVLERGEWPIPKILRGETVSDYELLVRLSDGREVIHRYNGTPIRDEAGKITLAVLTFRDVTERKRIEEERKRVSEILSLAQSAARVGTFDEDLTTKITTSSYGMNELYGFGPDQEVISTEDWLSCVLPEDREKAWQAAENSPLTGELKSEFRIRRRDTGEVRWMHARGRVFYDDEGKPVRLIGINLDITERKSAEESIAALTRHLEAHLWNTPLAVVEYAPDFTILRWSGEAERIFRFSSAEVVGKTAEEIDFVHRDDLPHVRAAVSDLLKDGKQRMVVRNRNCTKDKSEVECEWYISALRDEHGNLESLLCFGLDVTERERAEMELRRSKEDVQRYAAEMTAVFAAQTDAVVMFNPEAVAVRANPASIDLYGFDATGMALARILEEIHVSRGLEESVTVRALRGETVHAVEFQGTRTRGRPCPMAVSAAPMRDETGLVIGAVTVARDITERKRVEEALRRNAAELQVILDAVPAAVFMARDPDTRNITGNRTAYEFFRVEAGRTLSMSAPDGEKPVNIRLMRNGADIPPDDLPVQTAARTGQTLENFEFDVVYEDGSSRRLFGNAVPLLDEDGRPHGAVGAYIDITERVRAEERLRQVQKLESIGVLAGGIAHDFNNLLTGIMGNASLLMDEVPATSAERVGRILGGAERAADLTRQLLAYAGKGRFLVRELDISEIVQSTADLLRLSIPKNVQLEFNLQPKLPRITADSGQLQQLLMNLTSNAAEATEARPDGRVIVSTRACEAGRPFVDELGEEIPSARYVCLEVADNGAGMDEQTRKKIFDPFFTTKFTGRGLGLAAVAGIMRCQKGGIRIDTAPGKGTTFRLFFPSVEQPEHGEPPRKNAVLVVDDEEVVREFITAALTRAGYDPIPAANGKEALERWAEQQDRIALVVMDVVMPVMGGGELLKAFQRAQPDLKVLLTSGYNETEARRMCGECNVAGFIQKPYSARKLVDAVKSAIGEPAVPS